MVIGYTQRWRIEAFHRTWKQGGCNVEETQLQTSVPVIDRNPQRYVDSIFAAKESDYVAATQTIARSREAPSAIVLPVPSP
ncbi:hypothetical protein [Polyangium sorediatum]|uniref:Transposase n=1 Tax=Polyangium sorediatum TaxID=889274 RepID=A0ABT6NMY7_9BACT|nr:hypothetical protein [Polyangium sorediatum]MDI1429689.1 hypothetical protein [Polyangium sorediatum]